ncbi:putative RNA-binding protein of the translin family [Methanomethylovorans hollandica DSM 15978]|jgi:translin|uniref:Putative RNA-binding protein of the translin family n=1 Tax=Methanomethylovorans hollandica (strain DSM 15978 / NBRC 107637 / DMS1) TaxID=867904 RepID=L0KSX2_METHD|nr:RNA-binding protein [Methanomethylovorans hollandica]AGB48527.1 putative RNA-binding protein of the translin family [Methanomethylovorans hollandica DSM 15978]
MIKSIIEQIRIDLEEKDKAREQGIKLSREVVRNCRVAMQHVHKMELELAYSNIQTAKDNMENMISVLKDQQDIYYAGFVEHAQQEFTECSIIYALVSGKKIPGPGELKVEPVAYLNGLGDGGGEIKRHILDLIRRGMLGEGERYLNIMEELYIGLMLFDYPDAMTHGLRAKTDRLRLLLEISRGELTAAARQEKLEIAMQALEIQLLSRK